MPKPKKTKSISDQLRLFVERSDMSRYEISKRSDVDPSQLHRFVNRTGALKTDSSLDAVCEVLGLTLTEVE